jgi:hypothetical protein
MLAGEVPAREKPKALGGHLADQHGLIELVARCLESDAAKRPSAREAWTKLAKLPRPQEPTLFLESMQRPPELPVKEAPQLLKSVPMLTLTPMPSELPPPLPAAPAPRSRAPLYAVGALLGVGAIAGAVMGLSSSPARDARKLIEMRQPTQALEVLTKALRKESTPELLSLRVAALHLGDQHRDEEVTFKALPSGKHALDPLVLAGIAEDFGRREDAGLRAALKALPAPQLRAVLERFAQEPVSMKQWGALRWLDLEHSATGLKLVDLYSMSLESNTCAVRKLAAKRLQELDDDTAVDALQRLRDTPREGNDKGCGQEEAAAAVQALKRLK